MSRPVDALDRKRQLTDWWLTEGGTHYARFWLTFLQNMEEELIAAHERYADALRAILDTAEETVPGDDAPDEEKEAFAAAIYAEMEALREPINILSRASISRAAEYELVTRGDDWRVTQARQLRLSEAYWVSADMAAMTTAAYDSMPEQPLRREDLPHDHGFALVDGTASLSVRRDDAGRPILGFGAVSWAVMSAEIVTADALREQYAATSEALGDRNTSLLLQPSHGYIDKVGTPRARAARTAPGVRVTWWLDVDAIEPTGQPDVDEALDKARRVAHRIGSRMVPLSTFWPFGDTEPPAAAADQDVLHRSRWVAAFWHLMNRPMVAREPGEVDRHALKRARRAEHNPAVTVITLRAPRVARDPDAEPRHVEWTCRWYVRGFWRQQWYPSLGEHRAVWIDGYIKGPEDRPLRLREHVYAWRR